MNEGTGRFSEKFYGLAPFALSIPTNVTKSVECVVIECNQNEMDSIGQNEIELRQGNVHVSESINNP